MNFEEEICKKYPQVLEARKSSQVLDFATAIDIYSEILTNAIENEKISDEDPLLCYLYLEYSFCLIENCEKYFVTELNQILSKKKLCLETKKLREDDLEISWNILEIAKLVFNRLKLPELVARCYFMLGNIQCLNNLFTEAISDYSHCLDLLNSCDLRFAQEATVIDDEAHLKTVRSDKTIKMAECYWKISNCYEYMKQYPEAIKPLNDLIVFYEQCRKSLGDKTDVLISAIKDKIFELNERQQQRQASPSLVNDGHKESGPVIDINLCKRKKK